MGISDRKRNIEVPVSINLDLNQEPKPNQFLIDNNIKGGSFVSRKKSGNVFAGSKLNVDGQGIYNEKNITPDLFKKLPKQTPVSEGNPPIPTQTPTKTPSPTPTICIPEIIYDGEKFTNLPIQNGTSFKPDGTILYVTLHNGSPNDGVCAYSLSTPWDVSTITLPQIGCSIASPVSFSANYGSYFSPDGTKLFLANDSSNCILRYTLSTAWDISTSIYSPGDLYSGATFTDPIYVEFSPDGYYMFVNLNFSTIKRYTLSTPWVINTGVVESQSISAPSTFGIRFQNNGYYLFSISTNTGAIRIVKRTLSIPYDLTSVILTETSGSLSTFITLGNFYSLNFKDGYKGFIGRYFSEIYAFNLNCEWDINGIVILPTPTPTPTMTQTPTNTVTPTNTPTNTVTPSITPTISLTPSITPTISLTPSITPTNTPTPTNPCQNCIQVPVEIGTQIWDKCNLNVTTYSDGEPIPQVTGTTEWTNLTTGAWCHFDNDPANEPIYGKLYNGYALLGIYDAASLANPLLRKTFAPVGKHIPTNTEWNDLRTFLSGQTVAGGKMKQEGLCHWNTPNSGATNESGFTALGAGNRNATNGLFGGFNLVGIWWSSTPQSSGFNFNYSTENTNTTLLQSFALWEWGFSVRCLIDTPVTPTVTPTNTVTPTTTPTNTLTPTITPTITPTNTVTPSITPTNTPTPTITQTPTPTSG